MQAKSIRKKILRNRHSTDTGYDLAVVNSVPLPAEKIAPPMRFSMIATISIDCDTEQAAKAAARQLYDGIWDLMPELPKPNPVTIIVFNGKEWVTKIDSRRKR